MGDRLEKLMTPGKWKWPMCVDVWLCVHAWNVAIKYETKTKNKKKRNTKNLKILCHRWFLKTKTSKKNKQKKTYFLISSTSIITHIIISTNVAVGVLLFWCEKEEEEEKHYDPIRGIEHWTN